MSYNTIATVVNLLAVVIPHHQEQLLIENVNEFFNIDQNVFVLESSTNLDRFICHSSLRHELHECVPRSVFTFERLDDGVTVTEKFKEIISKNTFLIVASESSDFMRNANLFIRIKEIQRLNINMKIGLFFAHDLRHDLQKIFEWCWTHRIVNIFVAFYSDCVDSNSCYNGNLLNIFTYSPFGTFKVVNVTRSKSAENYFPSKISNFQQHPIRMGIYDNIWLFQYSARNQRVGGPDGKLWKVILEHLNASVTITVERDRLWQMLKTNAIDVVPFLHRFSDPELTYLYPMNMETEVIAVPEARPFPEFIAYLRSISSDNFFVYASTIIVTVMLLLGIIRYIKRKEILFFECVADVLNLLMNDNGYINYRQSSRSEGCLIVPLTFTGLIFVNGILSSLQSYVTRPIMQSQIDTVDGLYNSPLPIYTVSEYKRIQSPLFVVNFFFFANQLGTFWSTEVPNVLGNLSGHTDGWTSKVHLRKSSDLLPQIFAYNTTMSVLLFKTHVNVLLEHQKRMTIRGYHIPTQFYIFKFLSFYHVNNDFPFIERFNEIIQRLQSAGMYEKWTGELYDEVKSQVFSKNRSDYVTTSEETEIDSFPIPKFIIYGWTVGIMVLILEIISSKIATVMYVRRR